MIELKPNAKNYPKLKSYSYGFLVLAICLLAFNHWASGILAAIIGVGLMYGLQRLKNLQK